MTFSRRHVLPSRGWERTWLVNPGSSSALQQLPWTRPALRSSKSSMWPRQSCAPWDPQQPPARVSSLPSFQHRHWGHGLGQPGSGQLPSGPAAELQETFPPATRAVASSAVEQISSGLVLPHSNPTTGCRSLVASDSSTEVHVSLGSSGVGRMIYTDFFLFIEAASSGWFSAAAAAWHLLKSSGVTVIMAPKRTEMGVTDQRSKGRSRCGSCGSLQ